MEKPIWYEPHPVSPERKKELVAQGYRILDAKFMPHDYVPEWLDSKKEPSAPCFEGMNKDELIDSLHAYGISASKQMKKETLLAKLKEVTDGEV